MRIKMLRDYVDHKAGCVIELPEVAAKRFISTGYAEKTSEPLTETKALKNPPRDKSMKSPPKAKAKEPASA